MDEKTIDDIYEKLNKMILNGEVDEVSVNKEKDLPGAYIKKNFDDYEIKTYWETYGAEWGGETLYCPDHIDAIASDLQDELNSDFEDIKKIFNEEYNVEKRDIETTDDGFYGYITIEKKEKK